jgi:hydrogenase expression/formation protein HypE
MSTEAITLAHGGGGSLMAELLARSVFPVFQIAEPGEDAAFATEGLLMTTDSFVVKPLIFPGSDIGRLSVYGTVNDLAMRGGRPLAMTVGLIVEEGLSLEVFEQIVSSLADAARECGVRVVGGDMKVLEAGRGDGLYINTTGIGEALGPVEDLPSLAGARPGDMVLINGPVGEHGIAVLAAREHLGFAADVRSDCAPLHEMVAELIRAIGPDLHCLHDPTRGGLAAGLNEIACCSGVQICIDESALPRNESVEAACELLGFDPLHVANEGKIVVVVAGDSASKALEIMKEDKQGHASAVIGEVKAGASPRVELLTEIGTRRIVDMPSGELLPRIC